jgi:uncharacterized protein YyaL (SSP411 family)
MSDPTARNRLADAPSPYLQQHADNPVNWQPWGDAALAAAREREVPIFLSVGYAACHWCHVMAEESFEDPAIAERLNADFVPIKVDREERPDLDRLYQTICQQVTGRGGWPLSAFLTPELEPFFVGTYFPPESRQGAPGFGDLLDRIADSWADPDERAEIRDRAGQWRDALESEFAPDPAGDVPTEGLAAAADAALRGADREHGGWGRGPKFPHPGRVRLLLRAADAGIGDTDAARAVAREALDAMADRALFDHLGGGFHRYATDREWTVPHFEKMLYDNAELASTYVSAARAFGDGGLARAAGGDADADTDGEPPRPTRYRDVAARTLDFLDRELGLPNGGFAASLDAESPVPGRDESAEGAFYTWTPREVGDDLADLACDRFGVTDAGSVEGRCTLGIARSVADLAAARERNGDAIRDDLKTIRQELAAERDDRPRPARDGKAIAAWNGLAISAFAAAGVNDSDRRKRAADALSFLRDTCWNGDRLARRWADGDVSAEGYLDDYAFVGRAALDLYGVTGDVAHLAFAVDLARTMVDRFHDPDAGTLHLAVGDDLIARPADVTDRSTPSALGVAVDLLLSLDHFVADDFDDVARSVLATHGDRVRASPLEHASLVTAADRLDRGDVELTLAAAEWPDSWRETLDSRFVPRALLAPRPPTADGVQGWVDRLGLDAVPPIWRDRDAADEPTVYACVNRTCSPPESDLGSALDWATG